MSLIERMAKNYGQSRRAIDTHYRRAPKCTVFSEEPSSATVVYDDEPETVVHTGNYQGRFASLEKS